MAKPIIVVLAGGCAGGLVHAVTHPRERKIHMPFSRRLDLGFFGDIVLGCGAAVGVFIFGAPVINWGKDGMPSATFMYVLAISVVAGFSGQALVTLLSQKLLRQVEDIEQLEKKVDKELERLRNVTHYLAQGDFYKASGKFDLAIEFYDKALQVDPENVAAILNKAFCVKRTDQPDSVERALDLVNEALQILPDNERARYNRACYTCILQGKGAKAQILADLQVAIKGQRFYRKQARGDADLSALRDDGDFMSLVAEDGR